MPAIDTRRHSPVAAGGLFADWSRAARAHPQNRPMIDCLNGQRIPAISAYDAFVRENGMLSYGATANEIVGRAAAPIDKILGVVQ